jgi:hypothetical protein
MELNESSSNREQDDHQSTLRHKAAPARTGGITTTRPRETILSKIRDASQYLSDASAASAASGSIVPQAAAQAAAAMVTRHKGRTVNKSTPSARGNYGYTVSSEGRLVFQRLKDEVRFATVTAAVRSVLEHHRGLLQTLGLRKGVEGSTGGGSGGVRSFVALVCKDAAKAGGYRLCMRYFGSRLPAAVPWAIDALVRGDTLSRGMQEVLQIGIPTFPLPSLFVVLRLSLVARLLGTLALART